MRVSRIATGDWGKIKAFFDVTTTEGITIKGFKIVEGPNGVFVGCPSEKDSSGTYKDKVWMDKEIKDELTELAKDAFKNGINGGNSNFNVNLTGNQQQEDDKIPF
tara:strand:+ start:488 stop:802 length:315 start_codon:yes stop_codon:yes gene_type:complete